MRPYPYVTPAAQSRGFILPLILLIAAIALGVGATIAFHKFSKKPLPSPSPVIEQNRTTQTTTKNLNPNTGNLYIDIKLRMKEELK